MVAVYAVAVVVHATKLVSAWIDVEVPVVAVTWEERRGACRGSIVAVAVAVAILHRAVGVVRVDVAIAIFVFTSAAVFGGVWIDCGVRVVTVAASHVSDGWVFRGISVVVFVGVLHARVCVIVRSGAWIGIGAVCGWVVVAVVGIGHPPRWLQTS